MLWMFSYNEMYIDVYLAPFQDHYGLEKNHNDPPRDSRRKLGSELAQVNLQEASNQMLQTYGQHYGLNSPSGASFDDTMADPEPQAVTQLPPQVAQGELFKTLRFCS